MKNLLSFIICMSLVTFAFAQGEIDNSTNDGKVPAFLLDENGEQIDSTKPAIQFEEEKFDFGEIEEGEKYEHVFNFTNSGKEPLIITNVKASCGCTTPEWPKEPIMPGESSFIKAIYNSKNRPGPFNKSITITSNAVEPTKKVFIKGKVVSPHPVEKTTPVKEKSILAPKNN